MYECHICNHVSNPTLLLQVLNKLKLNKIKMNIYDTCVANL